MIANAGIPTKAGGLDDLFSSSEDDDTSGLQKRNDISSAKSRSPSPLFVPSPGDHRVKFLALVEKHRKERNEERERESMDTARPPRRSYTGLLHFSSLQTGKSPPFLSSTAWRDGLGSRITRMGGPAPETPEFPLSHGRARVGGAHPRPIVSPLGGGGDARVGTPTVRGRGR